MFASHPQPNIAEHLRYHHSMTGACDSHLNLWKKHLGEVPESVWQCTNLETLVLADKALREVSEKIRNLKQLRMLDLGHNQLTQVPAALGESKASPIFSTFTTIACTHCLPRSHASPGCVI
jgi:Leucine-rich repeat (LRR) protein